MLLISPGHVFVHSGHHLPEVFLIVGLQKVVKLFGKDVAKNFVTMATFCDGGRVLLKDAMEQSPIYKNVIR